MIQGIDISHNNDPKIDIQTLKNKGITFVWIKATQALTYQDPAFQDYWHACRANNMIHGAYHFFDPRVDGINQAKNFLSRGIDFTLPGVLPPCVDVEDLVGKDDAESAQLNKAIAENWKMCLNRLNDFLNYIKQQTGKDCIIYTYNNYPKEYYPGTKFPNNKMWLSSLLTDTNTHCPVRYDTGKLPEFWQYTYRLNKSDLDGDYFIGTIDQLNELANVKIQIS